MNNRKTFKNTHILRHAFVTHIRKFKLKLPYSWFIIIKDKPWKGFSDTSEGKKHFKIGNKGAVLWPSLIYFS